MSMSDRRESDSDFVGVEEHRTVVLQHLPPHQGLAKVNQFLLASVFVLMMIVFILGFFLIPDENKVIESFVKANTSDISANMNPAISEEVNTLKGQLAGLVSGSIESKLRVLEDNIRSGKLSSSLGMVEELKNDVEFLRGYVKPIKSDRPASISNEQLIREMSYLKRLVYMTLASCALIFIGFVGVWIKNKQLLPYQKQSTGYIGKK